MATEQDAVITTLDAKIEELEATLDALRRTRAFFAAERGRQGLSIAPVPGHAQDEASRETQHSIPTPMKSIGMMILDILQNRGKPMHVDELMPQLRAQGSQSSRATVIGTLSRYTADRKLRRVAPNTYGLKKPPHREQDPILSPSQEDDHAQPRMQPIQSGTLKYDCYTVLKEQGSFMTAREIYEALVHGGKTFHSQNPVDGLGSAMRDSIRQGEIIFARDEDNRFGLREWQHSQAPRDVPMNLTRGQNNGNNVNVDSVA
jgi:hypothetical protein